MERHARKVLKAVLHSERSTNAHREDANHRTPGRTDRRLPDRRIHRKGRRTHRKTGNNENRCPDHRSPHRRSQDKCSCGNPRTHPPFGNRESIGALELCNRTIPVGIVSTPLMLGTRCIAHQTLATFAGLNNRGLAFGGNSHDVAPSAQERSAALPLPARRGTGDTAKRYAVAGRRELVEIG